ncbi:MAG: PH domain-containing protein [Comamonadaceae bacterium]|nr:MAG: PH domain-containing protein [Comamonadaceae bacterium]
MSDDHDFEPAYGLPETLPRTERLLWQGAPDWRLLARDALHLRGLAIYFAVLLTWRGANALAGGGTLADALVSVAFLAPLAVFALATLAVLAWLMARTTVYTITDRRVVMRLGIVLTITFNLPYRAIAGASLHAGKGGSGDIALALEPGRDRIAYAHLWPHARPWRVKRTEPMLRALPDAAGVAKLLAGALAEAAGQSRQGLATTDTNAGAHAGSSAATGTRERDATAGALPA